MMRAISSRVVVAASDDTIVVEGSHYFPLGSLKREHLQDSTRHTTCPWKGQASYYHIEVDGEVNHDAAWTCTSAKSAASQIENCVAFWRGVKIEG
jgi:uncharacterized protein (DUF427 family)